MYDFWQGRIDGELRSLARAERWDQQGPEEQWLRGGSVAQQAVGARPHPAAQKRRWRSTVRWLLAGRWGRQCASLGETAATGGGTIV
jgi:hypothetical protein